MDAIVAGPTDTFQPADLSGTSTSFPVHPRNPRSTARRGTQRVKKPIRAVLPPPLPRSEALAALTDGRLDPSAAMVVWNVGDKPVCQRITDFAIPQGIDLGPVRRIGTYKGARSRMGWFPTVRDGHAIFLEAESRTEHHWLRVLDMTSGVTWLHTQPFVLFWTTGSRSVLHTPDILAIHDGLPRVVDVKPEVLRGRYDEAIFALTADTLAYGGVTFHVAGSPSQQSMVNHLAVHRWKRRIPPLGDLVEVVLNAKPRTVHHVFTLCGGHARGIPVLFHLRANGVCDFDLGLPLQRATQITWHEAT